MNHQNNQPISIFNRVSVLHLDRLEEGTWLHSFGKSRWYAMHGWSWVLKFDELNNSSDCKKCFVHQWNKWFLLDNLSSNLMCSWLSSGYVSTNTNVIKMFDLQIGFKRQLFSILEFMTKNKFGPGKLCCKHFYKGAYMWRFFIILQLKVGYWTRMNWFYIKIFHSNS